MPDMDDFFINDDELAADQQLTLLDEAKIKVLNRIEELSKESKINIEFGEYANFQNNFVIISQMVSVLTDLINVSDDASDEEIEDAIENAFNRTTEITYGNMNDIIPEDTDSDTLLSNSDDDLNDDGIDF